MSEDFIYDKGNIKVSTVRFVVGKHTYPIGHITSVKVVTNLPPSGWAELAMFAGVIAVIVGIYLIKNDGLYIILLGAISFGLGYFIFKGSKSRYAVSVTTAAGEKYALVNYDRKSILEIVEAVNETLIQRG